MAYQMWINGALTSGSSGKMIEVRNPATEEVIASVPAGNAADVDAAVTAAAAAFPTWKKLPQVRKRICCMKWRRSSRSVRTSWRAC